MEPLWRELNPPIDFRRRSFGDAGQRLPRECRFMLGVAASIAGFGQAHAEGGCGPG